MVIYMAHVKFMEPLDFRATRHKLYCLNTLQFSNRVVNNVI